MCDVTVHLSFLSLSLPFLNTTQTSKLISLPFLYQVVMAIVAALKKLKSVYIEGKHAKM